MAQQAQQGDEKHRCHDADNQVAVEVGTTATVIVAIVVIVIIIRWLGLLPGIGSLAGSGRTFSGTALLVIGFANGLWLLTNGCGLTAGNAYCIIHRSAAMGTKH